MRFVISISVNGDVSLVDFFPPPSTCLFPKHLEEQIFLLTRLKPFTEQPFREVLTGYILLKHRTHSVKRWNIATLT